MAHDLAQAGPEVLTYLVYTSTPTRTMLPEDLESILLTARSHNLGADITGLLILRDDCFIQFLEGPPREIEALMKSIAADDRHHQVRVVLSETTDTRSFADWRMGFATPKPPRDLGVEGVRDSFMDLTLSEDYGVVRQAAQDLSMWFTVKEAASASS